MVKDFSPQNSKNYVSQESFINDQRRQLLSRLLVRANNYNQILIQLDHVFLRMQKVMKKITFLEDQIRYVRECKTQGNLLTEIGNSNKSLSFGEETNQKIKVRKK